MEADADRDREAYWRARDWLSSAMHELPQCVLDGADGATSDGCRQMTDGLEGFARLCERLGLNDHDEFIAGCRWHLEHYPHYLGRRRHLSDYGSYTRDRGGPERVGEPPAPPRWLRRA